ncbi:MAG: UMP kinase [Candidatus Magasanikbacteria bacterium]|nr:UMP kinase [Candidatus Magasanikbacteria bacterium]
MSASQKRRETVAISLGGSMIINGDGIHVAFLKKFKSIIAAESKKGLDFIIITGGGKTTRDYQKAGRTFKFSDKTLDEIGISITHVNAKFVAATLAGIRGISVMGGEKPGQSTDAVAVGHAIKNNATRVINISSIGYIYSSDPEKNPDAQKFETLSWKEYRAIIGSKWIPGMHAPFDPTASRLAQKNNLTVSFMDGKDLAALPKILHGKKWAGSVIL